MTADDRTYVLRLLRERRASLASRLKDAEWRCRNEAHRAVDGRSPRVRANAVAKGNAERAHLVSLEAELARCDEAIAAVEALP